MTSALAHVLILGTGAAIVVTGNVVSTSLQSAVESIMSQVGMNVCTNLQSAMPTSFTIIKGGCIDLSPLYTHIAKFL